MRPTRTRATRPAKPTLSVQAIGVQPTLSVAQLRRLLTKTLAVLPRSLQSLDLSVAFVGTAKSAALNRQYRKKDKPADVLSFSLGTTYDGSAQRAAEILLCPPMIRARTKTSGLTVQQETALLFVHGVLHIHGFDHERDTDFRRMHALEQKVLGKRYFTAP